MQCFIIIIIFFSKSVFNPCFIYYYYNCLNIISAYFQSHFLKRKKENILTKNRFNKFGSDLILKFNSYT